MTDRDRLISQIISLNKPTISLQTAMDIVDAIIDEGVIVPPCKVGETAYMVTINGSIKELTVEQIDINLRENAIGVYCNAVCDLDGTPCGITIVPDKVGEVYFFTKEEAEQALKEREQSGC